MNMQRFNFYLHMATNVAFTVSNTISAITATIQKEGEGIGENLCLQQVAFDNISHNFVDEWRILIGGKYWTLKAVAQRKS